MEEPRLNHEQERMAGKHGPLTAWRRWGPYCSERSWGTVREDYSGDGNAWTYFPHDHARSRAYRWGEDGMAAICDRYQILCFALAFWNERDPILKERLFGVVPSEGNHGEDVKEYYFYLDSTPSHSYMKWLYKYPQREYPYQRLIEENQRRGGKGPEFELLDTGIFDDDRYFDVFVEYGKATPEDIAVRVTVHNRGPEAAPIQVLPHLWFRNTWSWSESSPLPEPSITVGLPGKEQDVLVADDATADPLRNLPFLYRLGPRRLSVPAGGEPLFTNNETHRERLYGPQVASRRPYVKDAFHRYVVNGETGAVDPARVGTKACVRFRTMVPAGGSVVYRFRLSGDEPTADPVGEVDAIVDGRRAEADAFYGDIHPARATEDERRVQRQAFAPTGGTSTRCASCPCPTSGSTRGSRPGTSPSIALPSPSSIRPSPRSSSGSSSSSSSSIRPGSCPPTSGSSPTSTRPCTPGRSGASTTWTGSATESRIASSSRSASTSC
jgi:hypothetical protein